MLNENKLLKAWNASENQAYELHLPTRYKPRDVLHVFWTGALLHRRCTLIAFSRRGRSREVVQCVKLSVRCGGQVPALCHAHRGNVLSRRERAGSG